MGKKKKTGTTQALRMLDQYKIAYTIHEVPYEPRGGTANSASSLGVDEHAVIKTLIMENENSQPLVVLMHGDCEVSTKSLARHLGVKTVTPCTPATADRHSGYQVGGTSPFGTRKPLPVYMEAGILELDRIWINGGRRGLLVELSPNALSILNPEIVNASVAD